MTFFDRLTSVHFPHSETYVSAGRTGWSVARIALMVLGGLIGAGAGMALDSAFNLFAE
ncbi:MAG TPA: hypothetical protein PLR76_04510 [Hyphomonas sp.]|nr:hypothetical protein [Hyphomonas sp.]MCA8905492.1 hypothetical protein [Hyphomonas sp.]MCB9963165.1 hypothetical protein [Hyphomonas sp.]MCB9970085.1 hypothetical protein [Hyphomonas sp.]HPE47631.1 hypothetical protein [Hyphomonas sp.]